MTCLDLEDLENWFYEQGFEQGFNQGESLGFTEGALLGAEQGVAIGQELGYYEVCVGWWKGQLSPPTPRVLTLLDILEASIKQFPQHNNDPDFDVQKQLEQIRANFKLLVQSLGGPKVANEFSYDPLNLFCENERVVLEF